MDDDMTESFLGFLAYGSYRAAEMGQMPHFTEWANLTADARRCWLEVARTIISFHKTLLSDPSTIEAMIGQALNRPQA
jgi:hypothetical protein